MEKLTAKDIEAKVGTVSDKGCQLLLYKTARVDTAILDKIYGPMNWQCDYKLIRDNMYCGIGVRNDKTNEWVWKWDCGIESREDAGNEKKGEASDAFKRAGFKWGIGVELYNSPFIWVNVETYGLKNEHTGKTNYYLKDRFIKFVVKDVSFDDNGEFTKLIITDKKGTVLYELGKRVIQEGEMTPAEKAKATREENKIKAEELKEKAKKTLEWIKTLKRDLTTEEDGKTQWLLKELGASKDAECEAIGNEIAKHLMDKDKIGF